MSPTSYEVLNPRKCLWRETLKYPNDMSFNSLKVYIYLHIYIYMQNYNYKIKSFKNIKVSDLMLII